MAKKSKRRTAQEICDALNLDPIEIMAVELARLRMEIEQDLADRMFEQGRETGGPARADKHRPRHNVNTNRYAALTAIIHKKQERIDQLAKTIAPYVHAQLKAVEQKVEIVDDKPEISREPLSDDEWERQYGGDLETPAGTAKSAR